MITLTALAALRQEEELALHVRAALRNGLSPAQIQEVLLQVAIYAGVPAANRAFAVAQRVLTETAGQEGRTDMAEIVSLAEAVALAVHDGDTVAMEGFTHLIPHAAGHEVHTCA